MNCKKNFYPESIIGHQRIIKFFQKAITDKNISHAYLFLGSSHIGKATIAKIFAQALQCDLIKTDVKQMEENKLFSEIVDNNDVKIPCRKCQSCKLVEKNSHPDTIILDGKENIKIEQTRELQHKINLKPLDSIYKICIIEDVERLTLEAANSLLKILEEPPSKSILILTCTTLNHILPTISSRCQIVKFQPVSSLEIEKELTKRGVHKKIAESLCLISCGKPGMAFNLASNPDILKKQLQLINNLGELKNSYSKQIKFAQDLIKNFTDNDFLQLENIMDFWLGWFRDLLLIKKRCDSLILNITEKEKLKKQAQNYNIDEIRLLILKISQTKEDLRRNVNPKLLIENLIFSLS